MPTKTNDRKSVDGQYQVNLSEIYYNSKNDKLTHCLLLDYMLIYTCDHE